MTAGSHRRIITTHVGGFLRRIAAAFFYYSHKDVGFRAASALTLHFIRIPSHRMHFAFRRRTRLDKASSSLHFVLHAQFLALTTYIIRGELCRPLSKYNLSIQSKCNSHIYALYFNFPSIIIILTIFNTAYIYILINAYNLHIN